MHLFLVRHGESFVNLKDWDQGFVDVGLTDLGRRQSERLATWLAQNVRVAVLYTSTMARTMETAAFVARAIGIEAVPDDRLREFGNVYADGVPVPREDMPVEYPGFWGTSRPHTMISAVGENWMLFRARVGAFLEDILVRHREDDRGAIVVVCHDGTVQATFDHVFNIGPSRQTEILTHNTGITHLEFHRGAGDEVWRLHSHGLVAHLLDSSNGRLLGEHQLLRRAGEAHS